MGHKIFEIGISSGVLSNICYWLIGTGLGLYIITLLVYGVMIISCGIDAHCYGWNNSICTVYNATSYNSVHLLCDISIVLSIVRSTYYLLNWLYQVLCRKNVGSICITWI